MEFIYIYIKKKLPQTCKINVGLWLTNVIEFYDFLILVKSVFEFKINKFYLLSKIWFKIICLIKNSRKVKRNSKKYK